MIKPSLVANGLFEGLQNAKIFKGLIHYDERRGSSIEHNSIEAITNHLEQFLIRNPKNWLALIYLGDWYIRDKRYADSIRVLTQAHSLRPKDPRSAYALATAFRVLTRARFLGTKAEDIFPENLKRVSACPDAEWKRREIDGFDPAASQRELALLGMTIDEAAEKALSFFEETLVIGVRSGEENLVTSSLSKMYSEFPHLEVIVKNKRRKSGFFSTAQSGSGGILNEAVSHYARLRYLMDDLPRFRYELGEVIRLCQWAIASDQKLGDAYVLLANAYSLLDSHVIASKLEHFYYMRWAAALIQYWNETALRNYPFTKNIEIGKTLYDNMLDATMRELKCSSQEAIRLMKNWGTLYLGHALNPATYRVIKEQLGS